MAIRKIVKLGEECLRKVCKPQEKFDLRLWILLKDMAEGRDGGDTATLSDPTIMEQIRTKGTRG